MKSLKTYVTESKYDILTRIQMKPGQKQFVVHCYNDKGYQFWSSNEDEKSGFDSENEAIEYGKKHMTDKTQWFSLVDKSLMSGTNSIYKYRGTAIAHFVDFGKKRKDFPYQIEESVNESVKYSDELVKAAIAHYKGCNVEDIIKLSDEAKGYSYQMKGQSNFKTISYDDVNSTIDQHKASLIKKFNINESVEKKFTLECDMKFVNTAAMALRDAAPFHFKDYEKLSSNSWEFFNHQLDEVKKALNKARIPEAGYTISNN